MPHSDGLGRATWNTSDICIPSYSTNLNLIERVWKFVKSELRTNHEIDFRVFVDKIDFITVSTAKENKAAVGRLIGERVQLFDELYQSRMTLKSVLSLGVRSLWQPDFRRKCFPRRV